MKTFLTEWGGWIFVASMGMFIASLWFVSWLVIRLPADFFMKDDVVGTPAHPVLHLLWLIFRNTLGGILIALGITMLLLPGQGVVTILLGLSFMTFPGKRRMVHWILVRKSVRRTMNWLRRKAHKPPLVFELHLSADDVSSEAEI